MSSQYPPFQFCNHHFSGLAVFCEKTSVGMFDSRKHDDVAHASLNSNTFSLESYLEPAPRKKKKNVVSRSVHCAAAQSTRSETAGGTRSPRHSVGALRLQLQIAGHPRRIERARKLRSDCDAARSGDSSLVIIVIIIWIEHDGRGKAKRRRRSQRQLLQLPLHNAHLAAVLRFPDVPRDALHGHRHRVCARRHQRRQALPGAVHCGACPEAHVEPKRGAAAPAAHQVSQVHVDGGRGGCRGVAADGDEPGAPACNVVVDAGGATTESSGWRCHEQQIDDDVAATSAERAWFRCCFHNDDKVCCFFLRRRWQQSNVRELSQTAATPPVNCTHHSCSRAGHVANSRCMQTSTHHGASSAAATTAAAASAQSPWSCVAS